MKDRTDVVCTLGSEADLFHVANTVTGLSHLEAQNHIRLALRRSSDIGPHAIVLELKGRLVGIDLSDHSDRMLPELSNCDIYFKRCIRPEDLEHQSRIRPFGLNYACRSRRATLRLFTLFGAFDLARRRSDWYKFLCIPLVTEFEREASKLASPTILFQARVWNLVKNPGYEQVNEERTRLLLALRSEFKERVVGGLVRTQYAQKYYPDLLTTYPSRQSRYVRWAREQLISIGFKGLFGSLGFKIAEAFAASQCLVSEPTAAYLSADAPLARYRSRDECIAVCDYILSHPGEASRMRNEAWEYYRTEVEPGAHIGKLLGSIQ